MSWRDSRRGSEKETLLDHLLPPPTHPKAQRRAAAVATLSVFLLLAAWLALTDDTARVKDGALPAYRKGLQSWVTGTEPVEMGSDRKGRVGEAAVAQEDSDENGDGKEEEEESASDDNGDDEEDAGFTAQSVSSLASYIWHKDLEWDIEQPGRLIVVGDVHGMVDELKRFLALLDYSPGVSNDHNDTLVFVGDLVAKHPDIQKSLETVDYIRSLNASAVRGNHDQDVINWRSLMDGSAAYSAATILAGKEPEAAPEDVPETMKHKWRDEHYKIAAAMSDESMAWMIQRSLTLHIRSLHTYVVHAGLLPWTIPKNKKGKHAGEIGISDEPAADEILADLDFANYLNVTPNTPLSTSSANDTFVPVTPTLPAKQPSRPGKGDDLDPEVAILTVPLNRKPYTLLEMRSLKKNGKVTKSNKKGRPWAPIWNTVMSACHLSLQSSNEAGLGRGVSNEIKQRQNIHATKRAKECRPLSVV